MPRRPYKTIKSWTFIMYPSTARHAGFFRGRMLVLPYRQWIITLRADRTSSAIMIQAFIPPTPSRRLSEMPRLHDDDPGRFGTWPSMTSAASTRVASSDITRVHVCQDKSATRRHVSTDWMYGYAGRITASTDTAPVKTSTKATDRRRHLTSRSAASQRPRLSC